jgi:hypothetical protein
MPEPSTSEPTADLSVSEPVTAPGAPITVSQEQLDRYAALVLQAMQLRNYVDLHRASLPADLVRRWDEWYQGLAQVLQRAQTDQIGLRHVLAQLPSYQDELARYRDAFAQHGGPRLGSSSPPEPGGVALKPLLIGGAGLALGLVAGFLVAGSRGA